MKILKSGKKAEKKEADRLK
ncbi:hypothetical protein KIPB_015691, partial [Kipferlia bialata]|eukprot:g15691.t1